MVERIQSGPYKGFYTLPRSLYNEQLRDDVIIGERDLYTAYKNYQLSLTMNDVVYYRYSPGPGKTILGFNRTLLPYIDGYYYVRKSSNDIRRLLYALENKLVPSTGNTELFNIDFSNIPVPDSYKPYYLDPCDKGWCLAPVAPVAPLKTAPLMTAIGNMFYLLLMSMIIAAMIVLFLNFV